MISRLKILLLGAVGLLFIAGGSILAGSLIPDSSPAVTMHSINDIYALIDNASPSVPSLSPQTQTAEPTMHSISELYVRLANLIDPADLASSSVTYLGISGGQERELVSDVTKEFDPTSNPGDVTGYDLDDIYNLIQENTRPTTTPARDFAPASAPTTGTLHTLDEIYTALAGLIQPGDISLGVNYLGVTGTYEVIVPVWYFKAVDDDRWSTLTNWWSNSDGTGINPDNPPWTTADTKDSDITWSDGESIYPVIDRNITAIGDINAEWTVTGSCDIRNIVNNAAGGIYSGTFAGNGFINNTSKYVYGGTFTGSGFTNNGSIDAGTFSGDDFTNGGIINGGTFSGNSFINGAGIYGGIFENNYFINSGNLEQGVYSGSSFANNGNIYGTTFLSFVSNTGTINSGQFCQSLASTTGTVYGDAVFSISDPACLTH